MICKCGHSYSNHTFSDEKVGCDLCECKRSLGNTIDELAAKNNEMAEILKEVKRLCEIIVNSPPETSVRGEIESKAFYISMHPLVLGLK